MKILPYFKKFGLKLSNCCLMQDRCNLPQSCTKPLKWYLWILPCKLLILLEKYHVYKLKSVLVWGSEMWSIYALIIYGALLLDVLTHWASFLHWTHYYETYFHKSSHSSIFIEVPVNDIYQEICSLLWIFTCPAKYVELQTLVVVP